MCLLSDVKLKEIYQKERARRSRKPSFDRFDFLPFSDCQLRIAEEKIGTRITKGSIRLLDLEALKLWDEYSKVVSNIYERQKRAIEKALI